MLSHRLNYKILGKPGAKRNFASRAPPRDAARESSETRLHSLSHQNVPAFAHPFRLFTEIEHRAILKEIAPLRMKLSLPA